MTEDEWLDSVSVPAMLRFLRGRVSDEKLRHFIRASAALAWPEHARLYETAPLDDIRQMGAGPSPSLLDVAESVHTQALNKGRRTETPWTENHEGKAAQARLLREIVGNPFRSQAVDLRWLSWNDGAVAKIARAIHDERAFDRLPILADALEDAGCTDRDILDHCRGPNEHVPGCWVLSLLLSDQWSRSATGVS